MFQAALYQHLSHTPPYPPKLVSGDIVVIQDKYPKAKQHYLAMHRGLLLDSVFSLTSAHLKQLLELQKVSEQITDKQSFKVGFHAIPSLKPLHLHIISTDMCGASLKTKAHYNSFVTEFLVPLSEVIDGLLQGKQFLKSPAYYQQLSKKDLVCHECGLSIVNMPTLKKHLLSHIN